MGCAEMDQRFGRELEEIRQRMDKHLGKLRELAEELDRAIGEAKSRHGAGPETERETGWTQRAGGR